METKTQVGVTVALAAIAGAYALGLSSSNDTVSHLKNSLSSYENAESLNTEEFLNASISAANSLKLSMDERRKLSEQQQLNSELFSEIKKYKTNIASLDALIKNNENTLKTIKAEHKETVKSQNSKHLKLIALKDSEIKSLSLKIKAYESKTKKFTLNIGGGISLHNGSIQVGYSSVEYNTNTCDVSVNNKHRKMLAGDFVLINDCKVVLTMCVYGVSDAPAKFELVCS